MKFLKKFLREKKEERPDELFFEDECGRPVYKGMVRPFGLKFYFLVSPKPASKDQKGIEVRIKVNSGITRFYSATYCVFDSPKAYGFPFPEEDNVVLKVLCVSPMVVVKKDEENLFYEDIKNAFSEWLSEVLKNGNYSCRLLEWQLVQEFSL